LLQQRPEIQSQTITGYQPGRAGENKHKIRTLGGRGVQFPTLFPDFTGVIFAPDRHMRFIHHFPFQIGHCAHQEAIKFTYVSADSRQPVSALKHRSSYPNAVGETLAIEGRVFCGTTPGFW
jgi:hypothetical protein